MNYETQYLNQFETFLNCMNKTGAAERLIIIGSWAEFLYDEAGIIIDEEFSFQTKDLDFLIIPESPLRAQKTNNIDITSVAKENGFLYAQDYIDGYSKFIGQNEFEVEFLIQQKGDGKQTQIKNSLGISPMPMPHMYILSDNTINVSHNNGMFKIPTPEAYVLHKMIINHSRGIKAESDRKKIHRLIPHLERNKFKRIVERLSKKETKAFKHFVDKYEPDLDANISIVLVGRKEKEIEKLKRTFDELPFMDKIGTAGSKITKQMKNMREEIAVLKGEHSTEKDEISI